MVVEREQYIMIVITQVSVELLLQGQRQWLGSIIEAARQRGVVHVLRIR